MSLLVSFAGGEGVDSVRGTKSSPFLWDVRLGGGSCPMKGPLQPTLAQACNPGMWAKTVVAVMIKLPMLPDALPSLRNYPSVPEREREREREREFLHTSLHQNPTMPTVGIWYFTYANQLEVGGIQISILLGSWICLSFF